MNDISYTMLDYVCYCLNIIDSRISRLDAIGHAQANVPLIVWGLWQDCRGEDKAPAGKYNREEFWVLVTLPPTL